MKFLNKLSIKQRLIWMFSFSILFFTIFGLTAIDGILRLRKNLEDLYNHPLVVTNTSLEVLNNILKIHRDIDSIILLDDHFEIQKNETEIADLVKEVNLSLDLINRTILGAEGKKKAKEVIDLFAEWSPLRDKVVAFSLRGDKNDAKKIDLVENDLVNTLEVKTRELNLYARNKANKFMEQSLNLQKRYYMVLILTYLIISGISFMVFILTLKSLLNSINSLKNVMNVSKKTDKLQKAEIEGNNEIVEMTQDYNNLIDELQTRIWLKDGMNKLSEILSGENSIQQTAQKTITFLSRYLEAGNGVFYSFDSSDQKLKLIASYALNKGAAFSAEFEIGFGVVGQVALEQKPILLKNIKKEESVIITGTVNEAPLNTYTFPLTYEDRLYGVIELASFEPFTKANQDFLHEASHIITISLFTSLQNRKIHNLLEEAEDAREKAEEITRQSVKQAEEVQEVNAQLEEHQQLLQQQSEELQQTNIQLEEQQQILRQQSEDLESKHKELEEKTKELQLSSNYKSEFLANMSHELRTPLNSIILLSKTILEAKKTTLSEKEIGKVKVIYTAGNELLRLINDVLDISKIEAGKSDLQMSFVNSMEFLFSFNDLFDSFAKDKGLQFTIEDRLKQTLFTDRDKLGQIIRNFLSNAFKFTEQGTVCLKAYLEKKGDYPVVISVSDTGLGISPENINKIFEAFHQVDGSISRKYGGTGLGLYICKQLSEMIDARIEIKSTPGEGSEFILLLPESTIKGHSIVENVPNDDRKSIKQGDTSLLIIEEDLNIANMMIEICHELGVKVIYTPYGNEGLELIEEYLPSGVVLDLVLPDISGLEILKKIKVDMKLKTIPVGIISEKEVNGTNLLVGATDTINKPISYDKLVDLITKVTGIKSLEQKQILLIDDHEFQRKAIIDTISAPNRSIHEASSIQEVFTLLGNTKFNLVIVDLEFKDGEGLNICRDIKENAIQVPIIIYTGKEISEVYETELKKYANSIILKTVQSYERLKGETELFLLKNSSISSSQKYINHNSNLRFEITMKGKKILIVDDDPKNIFVIAAALEDYGAIIIEAVNGIDALKKLTAEKIDIVLMDIMMPGMNGYECIKQIRDIEGVKDVPIIALTAKALKGDREKCIKAGANDYISKPVDYNVLLRVVNAWVNKR